MTRYSPCSAGHLPRERALVFGVLLATILFARGAAAQAPPSTSPDLTLAEAVRVPLEKNPTAQAADACAEALRQGIAEAGLAPAAHPVTSCRSWEMIL